VELHRPHEHSPFRSWRAFVAEIATIVIGVLIALSFEGVREWNHNRTLARDAREAIVRELTDNEKAVQGDLKGADQQIKNLEQALQFADEILKSGKTAMNSISLNVALGDLNTSSWQTADHTGALAHMAYGDVQKYSAAYVLQSEYQAQERRMFEHMSDALTLIAAGADPTTAPHADVERFRLQVLAMRADMYMQQQLGRQLVARYQQALKE
jgi:hypothetical protein